MNIRNRNLPYKNSYVFFTIHDFPKVLKKMSDGCFYTLAWKPRNLALVYYRWRNGLGKLFLLKSWCSKILSRWLELTRARSVEKGSNWSRSNKLESSWCLSLLTYIGLEIGFKHAKHTLRFQEFGYIVLCPKAKWQLIFK